MSDVRVKEYLQTHKKIKNVVREKTLNEVYCCVKVDDVANKLGIDPKTAKIHLDLMEIDEFGSYLDEDHEMFCSTEGIERLRERFGRRIRKE